MSKDVRLSVRVAESGANSLDKIVTETKSDMSKVVRETLMLMVTTPAFYNAVVKGLKRQKGIE